MCHCWWKFLTMVVSICHAQSSGIDLDASNLPVSTDRRLALSVHRLASGIKDCAAGGMKAFQTWEECKTAFESRGHRFGGNGPYMWNPPGCYLQRGYGYFNAPGYAQVVSCDRWGGNPSFGAYKDRGCLCTTGEVTTTTSITATTSTTTITTTSTTTSTTTTTSATTSTTTTVAPAAGTTTAAPAAGTTTAAAPVATTTLALPAATNACMRGLIQCRVDHAFDGFEYYVNGSSSIPACRSPGGARSSLGDNITFNMSICKPVVRNTAAHQHTSITLIPVMPWIVFSTRLPGPVTCVCKLELKKVFIQSQVDVVESDKEEKRHFEVDGLLMQLNNATGKFILDISSRVLPVVRVESCKISDGGVNELYLLKNFSLLSQSSHVRQLRVNISKMLRSSVWQLQMKSFTLPNRALIQFSCTVHHCAQYPCPRTARRLMIAEYSTGLRLPRRLSSGSLVTSISGDPNGVMLDFNQRTVGLTATIPKPVTLRKETVMRNTPTALPNQSPIDAGVDSAGVDSAGCYAWSQSVLQTLVGVCLCTFLSQMW